jgi:hypothetical protein
LQAREARRQDRAASRRLLAARIALRFGRVRRAYDVAADVLASCPGSAHAAAIRDAAVAALGVDPAAAEDDTVGEGDRRLQDLATGSEDDTVGSGGVDVR